MSLNRENDPILSAARSFKGRNMEGSFGTGKPKCICRVGFHVSSTLSDETLLEVAKAVQAVNKGGTVRNHPLLMKVSEGCFLFFKETLSSSCPAEKRRI